MPVEISDKDLGRVQADACRMTTGSIGRSDFCRAVEAVVYQGERLSVKDLFIEVGLVGLQNFGVEDSKQIPLVQKALQELGDRSGPVRLRDLITVKEIVAEFQQGGASAYLQSVDAILTGEEGFFATGALLVGVFAGLRRTGVDYDKQIPFVTIGLESLGVAVTAE
ncbi:hypothetical protein HY949_02715 [Candidatus Gottesmanbacteria bacterium]|nr:hypothetical protein [Candidatus Gottesmanbacteria bacterium]